MALQYSVAVRNAALDSHETAIGSSPKLEIRVGSPPANCAAADSGALLANLTLPPDWMNAAAGGTKTLLGTWQDTSADGSGTAGHFRVKDSAGATCHIQGTVGTSASDMIVDSTSFSTGQSFTINSFTLTAGNA